MTNFKNTTCLIRLAIIFMIVSPLVAISQVTNTTSSGTWNTAGNWDNGVPTATGTVTVNHDLIIDTDITIEGTCTINAQMDDLGAGHLIEVKGSGTMDVNADVFTSGDLTVSNTGSVIVRGCNTLEVGSVTISNAAYFEIEPCAELIVNGDLTIENNIGIQCDGAITVNGDVTAKNSASVSGSGSLSSTGSVDINNGADLFGNTGDCPSGPCAYGSPLPIELLSFEAIANKDKVDIKWVTASEMNNDYFVIERSEDGQNFKTVLSVDGAGNSVETIEYYDTDTDPVEGVSYYRLKQVDFDGNYSYSNIVPVEFHADGQGQMLIFPNPASSVQEVQMKIKGLKGKEVLVVLRDITGVEVYSKVVITETGSQLIGFDEAHQLTPGTYLITASDENVLYSKTLVIK